MKRFFVHHRRGFFFLLLILQKKYIIEKRTERKDGCLQKDEPDIYSGGTSSRETRRVKGSKISEYSKSYWKYFRKRSRSSNIFFEKF